MAQCGTVLITGCSSGIGLESAAELASAGYFVIACCRSEANVAAIRNRLGSGGEVLILDVNAPEYIGNAVARVEAALNGGGSLTLINNAGEALAGPIESLTLMEVQQQFSTNVFGPLNLTIALLPILRRVQGRIINVSSVSGLLSFPNLGAYTASKFALEALTDALRMEMQPFGVSVVLIEPGAVKTEIWRKAARDIETRFASASHEVRAVYEANFKALKIVAADGNRRGVLPKKVAKTILTATLSRRPAARYTVGADALVGAVIRRVLPTFLLDRILPNI